MERLDHAASPARIGPAIVFALPRRHGAPRVPRPAPTSTRTLHTIGPSPAGDAARGQQRPAQRVGLTPRNREEHT